MAAAAIDLVTSGLGFFFFFFFVVGVVVFAVPAEGSCTDVEASLGSDSRLLEV